MDDKKMNPVVHFEMPAEDRKRMGEFYSKVFGWNIQMLGEEMGNYVLAVTTESDEKGPMKPGAINGGFYPKTKDSPQCPSIVISVEDLNEYSKKVTDAGGRILEGPMEIMGIGTYASFLDSEGNRVGMLQPAGGM